MAKRKISTGGLEIPSQIFSFDVAAEIGSKKLPQTLVALEEAGLWSASDGDHTELSLDEHVTQALLRARMGPATAGDEVSLPEWAEPFRTPRLRGLIPLVKKLRILNEDGFALVHGIASSQYWAWTPDGTLEAAAPKAIKPPELQLFGLKVTVPRAQDIPVARAAAEPSKLVRPYGADPDDLRDVTALAQVLAMHIRKIPGGKVRLKREPTLDPICTLFSTIRVALDSVVTTARSRALLEACLRALGLGQHAADTARRLLLRTHPRHIYLDPTSIPDFEIERPDLVRCTSYVEAADGQLSEVDDPASRTLRPTILMSLTGSEPY